MNDDFDFDSFLTSVKNELNGDSEFGESFEDPLSEPEPEPVSEPIPEPPKKKKEQARPPKTKDTEIRRAAAPESGAEKLSSEEEYDEAKPSPVLKTIVIILAVVVVLAAAFFGILMLRSSREGGNAAAAPVPAAAEAEDQTAPAAEAETGNVPAPAEEIIDEMPDEAEAEPDTPLLDESQQQVSNAFIDMIISGEYPGIASISSDVDYTEIKVTMMGYEFDFDPEDAARALIETCEAYHTQNGTQAENIKVQFITSTGAVLNEINSQDISE